MLRASAITTNEPVDLHAVVDDSVDSLLPGGAALITLVDAAVIGSGDLDAARRRVQDELGSAALVDAAGVIGSFEMMNRVADATGFTEGKKSRIANAEMIAEFGFERFDHID